MPRAVLQNNSFLLTLGQILEAKDKEPAKGKEPEERTREVEGRESAAAKGREHRGQGEKPAEPVKGKERSPPVKGKEADAKGQKLANGERQIAREGLAKGREPAKGRNPPPKHSPPPQAGGAKNMTGHYFGRP